MRRTNLLLSLTAGLVGGGLSHYLFAPRVVQAQAQWQPLQQQTQAPRQPAITEVRAQSFTLVDKNGAAAGAFYVDASGKPRLEVYDHGRTISIYPESAGVRPITGIPSR